MSKCPKGHLTPSLVSQPLSEEQWAKLDKINDELTQEYSVRRQMLLTRCDVTVQSFRWSDRVKVSTCVMLWSTARSNAFAFHHILIMALLMCTMVQWNPYKRTPLTSIMKTLCVMIIDGQPCKKFIHELGCFL